MANNTTENEKKPDYLEQIKSLAEQQKTANTNIADTEFNTFMQYANQQKNNYGVDALAQKRGAYQAKEMREQGIENLYANAGLSNSGKSETGRLQLELALQDEISAINNEERNALKSLQDLINQKQNENYARKQEIESDYLGQLSAAAAMAEEKREQNKAAFLQSLDGANSVDDIKVLASIYGVDDAIVSDAEKIFTNQQIAAGEITDLDKIASIAGQDSDAYKKAQENTYNDFDKKLDDMVANGGDFVKFGEEIANSKISEEQKQKLTYKINENVIAGVNSQSEYDTVVKSIKYNNILTAQQKQELYDKLKTNEYNKDGFKRGGFVKAERIQRVTNKGDERDTKTGWELGHDFKITVNGEVYWIEAGTRPLWNESNAKGKMFAKCPKESFCYWKGKLYYKDTSGAIIKIDDVNRSEEGHKTKDLIEALQAESVKNQTLDLETPTSAKQKKGERTDYIN